MSLQNIHLSEMVLLAGLNGDECYVLGCLPRVFSLTFVYGLLFNNVFVAGAILLYI